MVSNTLLIYVRVVNNKNKITVLERMLAQKIKRMAMKYSQKSGTRDDKIVLIESIYPLRQM